MKSLNLPQRQQANLDNYHKNIPLQNLSRGKKTVITFKLLGNQYSTNLNRTAQYCLDDKWKPITMPLHHKILLVLTKRVNKLRPTAKSRAVSI